MTTKKGPNKGRRILILVISAMVMLAVFNFITYLPVPKLEKHQYQNQPVGEKQRGDQQVQIQSIRRSNINSLDSTQFGICGDVDGLMAVRKLIKGNLICPKDGEYERAVQVFNTRLVNQLLPAAVVQPRQVDDIVAALHVAKEWVMNVTVKDGGHNPAAHALSKDGLMIDMQFMKNVYMEENNVLVSEGGARWRDVHPLLAQYGRSMVAGGCPQVGVVGLILGGGVGWLSRNRGLASDRVLSLEIVFPNGTLATITKESNAELFWALRLAGGSNFGVVTKASFETFPAYETYFGGKWCVFQDGKDKVSNLMVKFLRTVGQIKDNRLTADAFVGRMIPSKPNGAARMDPSAQQSNRPPSFCFALFFDGPKQEGRYAAQSLLNLFADEIIREDYACADHHPLCPAPKRKHTPSEVEKQQDLMRSGAYFDLNLTYVDWLKSFGMDYIKANWMSLFFETKSSDELGEIMATYLTDVKPITAPKMQIAQIQVAIEHVGGAMSCEARQPREEWPHCKGTFMISMQAFNGLNEDNPMYSQVAEYTKTWTQELYDKMLRYSDRNGAYGNYADPEQKNWQILYYGEEGYKRLQRVKRSIEGWEIFQAPQTINPYEHVPSFATQELLSERDENSPSQVLLGKLDLEREQQIIGQQQEQQLQQSEQIQPQELDFQKQGTTGIKREMEDRQNQIEHKQKRKRAEFRKLDPVLHADITAAEMTYDVQRGENEGNAGSETHYDIHQDDGETVYNTQQGNQNEGGKIGQQNNEDGNGMINEEGADSQQYDMQSRESEGVQGSISQMQLQSNSNNRISHNRVHQKSLPIQRVAFSSPASQACTSWLGDLASITAHLQSSVQFEDQHAAKLQQLWLDSLKFEEGDFVTSPVAKSMLGHSVLITGGTGGLGQSTALALAILGADVIVTSRSQRGCDHGVKYLQLQLDSYTRKFHEEQRLQGSVSCSVLDLEDVGSIANLAANLQAVDVVVLNAAYMGPFKYAQNPSKLSAPFMVNHLGHYLLTHLLLGLNKINKPGRIVLVSSAAAKAALPEHLRMFAASKPYETSVENQDYLKQDEMGAYAAGKLSNILYMQELNERFKELIEKEVWAKQAPITVNVAIPSITVPTRLSSRLIDNAGWKETAENVGAIKIGSPAESAMTSIYLAAEPTVSHLSGKIMSGCQEVGNNVVPKWVTNNTRCDMWKLSYKLLTLDQNSQNMGDVEKVLLKDCPDAPI